MAMNVDFNPEATATLERLRKELGTSKAEILRMGLALLVVATREQRAGNSVAIAKDGLVLKEVVGAWSAQ